MKYDSIYTKCPEYTNSETADLEIWDTKKRLVIYNPTSEV